VRKKTTTAFLAISEGRQKRDKKKDRLKGGLLKMIKQI
jgi:hypothetical protein